MSEELDAVASANEECLEDAAQRVVTLQGPVAVTYSQKLDEPVCDVFAEICDGYVELYQKSAEAKKPETVEYFGGPVPKGTTDQGDVTFAEEKDLPTADAWMHELSGAVKGWRSAALLSKKVVRAKEWVSNPLPGLLTPQVGQRVSYSEVAIKVWDAGVSEPVIELALTAATMTVTLIVRDCPPPTREVPAPAPAVLTSTYK